MHSAAGLRRTPSAQQRGTHRKASSSFLGTGGRRWAPKHSSEVGQFQKAGNCLGMFRESFPTSFCGVLVFDSVSPPLLLRLLPPPPLTHTHTHLLAYFVTHHLSYTNLSHATWSYTIFCVARMTLIALGSWHWTESAPVPLRRFAWQVRRLATWT